MDLYTMQPNPKDPTKFDVIRNAPTVISDALKRVEAEALVFAMNVQVNILEGRLKR